MRRFKQILLEENGKMSYSGVEGYLKALSEMTSGKQIGRAHV